MATTIATNVKNGKQPTYRLRKGYTQAIVTLTDEPTGRRRDYWLGEHGTPASYENYYRLLADWKRRSHRFPPKLNGTSSNDDEERKNAMTVNELALAYWQHASSYYSPAAAGHIKLVIRLVRRLYGHVPASEFGPNDLRLIRDEMIKGDLAADPPRKPWSRCYVNSQIHRLCRIFNWGASHEMIPVEVFHRLKSVGALRRGKSEARETEPITPVAVELVNKVRPHLNRQVRALVDLQLLTGARGGELFKLRPIDIQIDQKNDVWTVNLKHHKTAHLGKGRTLILGPKAQAVIAPFMVGRALDKPLFSPAEAEQERRAAIAAKRRTPKSCGNTLGSNRVSKPRKKPGDHYTSGSYRRAIAKACEKADVPAWHPHRLRHTAATLIRREFGLEAARIVLGHSSALITNAIYAERDSQQIETIMKQIG